MAVNGALGSGLERNRHVPNWDKTGLSCPQHGWGWHIRGGWWLLLLPGEGYRGLVPLGCCARGELWRDARREEQFVSGTAIQTLWMVGEYTALAVFEELIDCGGRETKAALSFICCFFRVRSFNANVTFFTL